MQPFTYVKARTAADAVRAMADGGPRTRFLAGGTTLFDLMKLNVETPTNVVDVAGLKELDGIDTGGSRELVFGALALAPPPPTPTSWPSIRRSQNRSGEQPRSSSAIWRRLAATSCSGRVA